MAMSKEQQKAAAVRILEKEALTVEEKQTFEMLVRRPEEYLPPGPHGERVCGLCGEEFKENRATKDTPAVASLDQFSDHQSKHNPSAAQWSEAHQRIQSGKEREKNAQ